MMMQDNVYGDTQARAATINWLSNSTKCCYGNAPNPDCTIHTAEWIDAEVQARIAAKRELAEFHREWTTTLSEIVPKMSGRKLGERLVELGLRVYDEDSQSYRASAAALQDEIAQLREEYGHWRLYWHRERVVTIILDGVDAATLYHWQQINDDRERYEAELARLSRIIDHNAYLTDSEQWQLIGISKSGVGNGRPIFRRATQRAYRDQQAGKSLVLR